MTVQLGELKGELLLCKKCITLVGNLYQHKCKIEKKDEEN